MKSRSRWSKCKPFDLLIKRPNDFIICSFAQTTKWICSFAHLLKQANNQIGGSKGRHPFGLLTKPNGRRAFGLLTKPNAHSASLHLVWWANQTDRSVAHLNLTAKPNDQMNALFAHLLKQPNEFVHLLICSNEQITKWTLAIWFGHQTNRASSTSHLVCRANQTQRT